MLIVLLELILADQGHRLKWTYFMNANSTALDYEPSVFVERLLVEMSSFEVQFEKEVLMLIDKVTQDTPLAGAQAIKCYLDNMARKLAETKEPANLGNLLRYN